MKNVAFRIQRHPAIWFLCHVVLVVLLSSCHALSSNQVNLWRTYTNPRYGFEFPYPMGWISAPISDNRDGQTFHPPQKTAIEMRGWASSKLPDAVTGNNHSSSRLLQPAAQPNFVTHQGLIGELKIEIGLETSVMSLTLGQERTLYYWQGRSPSQQFADYYRFFYYSASQYQVLPQNR